jgi:hypothetical protein
MNRLRYNCAFVLLLLVQGCAALGIPSPTTFNQRIAVAYTTVSEVRGMTSGLLTAGKISPDDAQNVQNQADNARAGIELARQVYGRGDSAGADSKLAQAQLVLTALQAYLKGR